MDTCGSGGTGINSVLATTLVESPFEHGQQLFRHSGGIVEPEFQTAPHNLSSTIHDRSGDIGQ